MARIDTTDHYHEFDMTQKCSCGARRIRREEFDKRESEWDGVYQKSKDTESAATYYLCREAFSKGDYGAVQHFASLARERLAAKDYLSKPNFPDPRLGHHYFDFDWVVYGKKDKKFLDNQT